MTSRRLLRLALGLVLGASRPLAAQRITTIDSTTTLGPVPARFPLHGVEFGLIPTAMHYTANLGTAGAWGGGATLTLGYFFKPWLGVEGQMPVTVNPDLNLIAKEAPNFYSGTVSAVLVDPRPRGSLVQPYLTIGGGYDWYFLHQPVFKGLAYRVNGIVGHGGVGARFRLGDVAALRVELSTDVGRLRPSQEGLFGVSFFPWTRRRPPQVERTVITRQLVR